MTDPEMAMRPTSSRFTGKWYARLLKKRPGRGAANDGRSDGAELRAGVERQGVLEEFGVTMIGATADRLIKQKTAVVST